MSQAYRCSSGHHLAGPVRESSKFLSGPVERAMVAQYLSFPSPILEVFNRPAILPRYQSRFGPTGLKRNPLYVASDIDTTFYEFGFHLLNSGAVQDQEIKITCFNLDVLLQGIVEDPRNDPNAANILSGGTNYTAAHHWFNSLPAIGRAHV